MIEGQRIIELIDVDEHGIVHIKEKIVSSTNQIISRTTIAPGEDYSQQPEEVQKICRVAHTELVVEKYQSRIREFSISQQTIPESEQ